MNMPAFELEGIPKRGHVHRGSLLSSSLADRARNIPIIPDPKPQLEAVQQNAAKCSKAALVLFNSLVHITD